MAIMGAERQRRRIRNASTAGMALAAYMEAVCDLIRTAVPYDAMCLATTDPATLLLTSAHKVGIDGTLDREFASFEYLVDDVNLFGDLARRADPVGVLFDDTEGDPSRSARWRDFLVPHFGFRHEMRAVLRAGQETWGLAGLYREGTSQFSPAEAAFLASLGSTLAAGLRAGLLVTSSSTSAEVASGGPAVVVVGPDDHVLSATPAAAEVVAALREVGEGGPAMTLHALVAAARAFGRGRRTAPPRVRVRTASAGWLVLAAAPLLDEDQTPGNVVVTIAPAGAHEVAPLLEAAYGLSEAERRVMSRVLAGHSTQQIAASLYLSPYTVQDHLKSIFTKAGVRSRRELTAQVYFDQYAPRLNQPIAPTGWFAEDRQTASPPA